MKSPKSPLSRILDLVKLEKAEIWSIYFYAILNGLILLSVPLGIQSIVGFVLGASFRASIYVLILLVVVAVLVSGLMQINQMKIIEGRVTGFVKEVSLLEQAFAKDAKKSVQQILDEAGTAVKKFHRFRVGQ